MKKFVALSLVLVLVLGLCATAFAAYPTASLKKKCKYQYVYHGDSVPLQFDLNSNSYSKKGKTYYASLWMEIRYKKTTGKLALSRRILFTGNKVLKVNVKTAKNQKRGKYYLQYGATYRHSPSGSWFFHTVKNTYFTVY